MIMYVMSGMTERAEKANIIHSFLTATGKVNRGIRDTLKSDPKKFTAINNGIVLAARQPSQTIGPGRDGQSDRLHAEAVAPHTG